MLNFWVMGAAADSGHVRHAGESALNIAMAGPVVNNFNIQIATVNGSGSLSANQVLLRTIFRMGVPVSSKNIFPSNIAGLPTWFALRISEKAYAAHKAETDVMVAVNPQTAAEDAAAVQPGGVLLADAALALAGRRSDLHYYEAPFAQLAAPLTPDTRIRRLLVNMIYAGALAHLLALDLSEMRGALDTQFHGKTKVVDLNLQAIMAGHAYAAAHFAAPAPYRVERRTQTQGRILIDGNAAAALGAMFGGCSVAAWYPITPSSSLIEQLTGFMQEYRRDPVTGKKSYAIVQTEDELAAIGIAIGAGWAGARAMTSTSGPGISLMSEFVGLAYFAEVPLVVWDIQRAGPSTGLPTRTSQGDVLTCYFLSHGDTRHLLLLPGTVKECFRFAQKAFNLAEKFQTPVLCLSDLDLGMNYWMSEEFQYPDSIPIDRGKVLSEKDLEQMKEFARYRDVDGDGVPYRTIPGNRHPLAPYFTRGSAHTEHAGYSESPQNYAALLERLARKIDGARTALPPPVIDGTGGPIGIIAYGSTHPAVEECRDQLREEYGMDTDYARIRALPPHGDVGRFLEDHARVYVVEQNRDGQMRSILALEFPESAAALRSVGHCTGVPIDARSITQAIVNQEKVR